MRRAALAGAATIEHGDGGTPEVFRLMKERGVALCPTLAAAEAYAECFDGWRYDEGSLPARVRQSRAAFRAALAVQVARARVSARPWGRDSAQPAAEGTHVAPGCRRCTPSSGR